MFPMYSMNYLVYMAPVILFSMVASWLVKSRFMKYSKVQSQNRLTGAQAAERMLRASGVFDVKIERISGTLTDHYDPSCKVLRLSEPVYASTSVAAIGVACHEAGHALQHAESYGPLRLRSAMVPVVNFSSKVSTLIIYVGIGLLMANAPGEKIVYLGIILMCASVLFALVTLPVEWNASVRAKERMVECGIVSTYESGSAGKVLNVAFLTYVAAAASSLVMVLYWLNRAKSLSRR